MRARGLTLDRGRKRVLDGVDLDVPPSGVLGLVGPNGSGKTTLLRCLYGSLAPDAGSVTVGGRTLGSIPRKQLAREIAVVAQEQESDIPIRVADLVMLGRLPYLGATARPRAEDERIVEAALDSLGALDLAPRDVQSLSGGERQRALIARALAQETPYLFLDEPTNHLDVRYQYELLKLVANREGSTVVVLHDLNLAARYCDRLVLLDHGGVVAAGTPDEILLPEVLAPVYRTRVDRVDVRGRIVLLFDTFKEPK
ncbi:ABC transporter ATP-binding protein [Corynebacterium frankenforstense]